MAKLSITKLTGIVLMICGIGLAYWGYDLSGGFESKMNSAFAGSDTNDVMMRYIGGAISFVVGTLLLLKK